MCQTCKSNSFFFGGRPLMQFRTASPTAIKSNENIAGASYIVRAFVLAVARRHAIHSINILCCTVKAALRLRCAQHTRAIICKSMHTLVQNCAIACCVYKFKMKYTGEKNTQSIVHPHREPTILLINKCTQRAYVYLQLCPSNAEWPAHCFYFGCSCSCSLDFVFVFPHQVPRPETIFPLRPRDTMALCLWFGLN